MAEHTSSSITIEAAAADVMGVIADFARYPDWTGEVKEAEVLKTDGEGRAEQVRLVMDAGAIKDTYVLDYDWDVKDNGTGVVSWSLVQAGVLKAMNGSYTLTESGKDETTVTYRLAVDVKIPMLGMLKRKAEKVIIDTALKELKKRVESVA